LLFNVSDICKLKELISVLIIYCTAVFIHKDIFKCSFKCNYLFNCRLKFKNMVLRKIFGGKLVMLTFIRRTHPILLIPHPTNAPYGCAAAI